MESSSAGIREPAVFRGWDIYRKNRPRDGFFMPMEIKKAKKSAGLIMSSV